MTRSIPDVRLPALSPNLASAIRRAVGHLIAGGVVIAPTEASYGLFASVRHPAAIARVVALKGRGDRPRTAPLPLVVAGAAGLAQIAKPLGDDEQKVAQHFWPGPLTLVLRAHPDLPAEVSAGTGTVGVRVPPHPVAAALCAAAGPLTASSANCSGAPAARRVEAIDLALLAEDVLVVDGGPCGERPPSSVVRLFARGTLEVLREGPITADQIEAVLGR